MNHQSVRVAFSALSGMHRALGGAIVCSLALTGCGGKILRENVLATTQSTIGVTIAQNVQTQSYELKAGFARNEFFLVPTSKRVINDADNHDADGTASYELDANGKITKVTGLPPNSSEIEHSDPSSTPDVLAEIQVGGTGKQTIGAGAEQGAGLQVYQRLAVGKLAVQSSAAVALMAHDAQTAAAVQKKSETPFTSSSDAFPIMRDLFKSLKERAAGGDVDAQRHRDALNQVAASLMPTTYPFRTVNEIAINKTPGYYTLVPDLPSTTFPATTGRDFDSLVTYMSQLDASIATVQSMLSSKTPILIGPAPTGDPAAKDFRAPTPSELSALSEALLAMRTYSTTTRSTFSKQPSVQQALSYFFGLTAPEAK